MEMLGSAQQKMIVGPKVVGELVLAFRYVFYVILHVFKFILCRVVFVVK